MWGNRLVAHGDTVLPPGSPRLPWSDLPALLRASVEAALGAPVVAARTCAGGFSPGTAAVLTGADGRRGFLKAVGTPLNRDSVTLHRAEARVAAALPSSLPVPALRWSTEWTDGADTWVALLFDAVEGTTPPLPWTPPAAARVVEVLADLAAAGSPCPVPDLPPLAEAVAGEFAGWAELAADQPADQPAGLSTDQPAGLDPWERDRLDWLVAAPERLAASGGLDGDTLVHLDVRADNLLVAPDGRLLVVDWPWAARGPAWVDTLLFALDPALHGGVDPEALVSASPVAAAADPAAVTDLLAGFTGMWAAAARRPAPPGLPTLRDFQRRCHAVALAWLRRRVDGGS